MYKKGVEAEAAHLPLKMGLEDEGPQGLQAQAQTQEGLRLAFDRLVQELQGIAEATTPWKKANRGFNSPWWSEGVKEALQEAREAEREHREAPTPYTRERLN